MDSTNAPDTAKKTHTSSVNIEVGKRLMGTAEG